MDINREKIGSAFFGISNYIYIFLLANLYFLLTNIIFIEAFLVVDITFETLPIYFLSLVLSGPSLTAICSVMRKIIDKTITSTTKEFFKAYKDNFLISLKIWLPILTLIFALISLFYLLGVQQGSYLLGAISIICILILIGICLYIFPILSKFELPYINYFLFSLYYLLKKPTIFILMILVITIVCFSVIKISYFFMMFSTSITAFVLMYFSLRVHGEIEQKIVKES